MKTLKPCPFCGHDDCEADVGEFGSHVTCLRCEAQGPAEETAEKAAAAWNSRPLPTEPAT
jgi:Lar family restriction alleviation protein